MSTENAVLNELLAGASLEAPAHWVTAQPALSGLLPAGTQVYVPHPPGSDFQDTVAAVAALADAGLCPVPHLPVRTIGSTGQAHERLSALAFAGADALLLIAGDQDRPSGPYASTLDLLESGLLAEYGFHKLGVAGHPEGHRRVSDAELARALAVKKDYAAATGSVMWIVTQFLFSAESALTWLHRVREDAHPLPIRIGLPGPTHLRTLLAYAARCGVGVSATFLARHTGTLRLLGGWSPEPVMRELAGKRASADGPLFSGLHFFPFGGVARCAEWITELRTRTSDVEVAAPKVRDQAWIDNRVSAAGQTCAYDETPAASACWAMKESDQ